MKAALKYFFLYILLIIVGFLLLVAIYSLANSSISYADLFGNSLFSSFSFMFAIQLLPIFVFLKRKYTSFNFNFGYRFGDRFSKKKLYQWAAIASVGCLIFDMMMVMIFPIVGEWDILLFGNQGPDSDINFLDVISGCLVAPLVEEAIFRGAIERRLLEKNWNPWYAIVISAVMFAIPHASLYTLFLSCFGIFVGWLYYRTRSIWPGILVHALYNSLAIAAVYIYGLLSVETSNKDEMMLPLVISIPLSIVGIFILYYSVKQIAFLTKDRTPLEE